MKLGQPFYQKKKETMEQDTRLKKGRMCVERLVLTIYSLLFPLSFCASVTVFVNAIPFDHKGL
jgi:hypothetical protein